MGLTAQAALGIVTLLYAVPVVLGLAHQIVALALVALMVSHLQAVFRSPTAPHPDQR